MKTLIYLCCIYLFLKQLYIFFYKYKGSFLWNPHNSLLNWSYLLQPILSQSSHKLCPIWESCYFWYDVQTHQYHRVMKNRRRCVTSFVFAAASNFETSSSLSTPKNQSCSCYFFLKSGELPRSVQKTGPLEECSDAWKVKNDARLHGQVKVTRSILQGRTYIVVVQGFYFVLLLPFILCVSKSAFRSPRNSSCSTLSWWNIHAVPPWSDVRPL